MLIRPHSSPGYDFNHYSHILQRNKTARVIIPNKSENSNCKIVYLLHPFATNRFFWTDFFHNNNMMDLSYIFVLPESGRSWLINDNKGQRYEDYLILELMKEVESQLGFVGQRIIGGFSMGGAASFFLALRYPELFELTFSLSGAFGAFARTNDPYCAYRSEKNVMIPTVDEHERVWGKSGSVTRGTYNLHNLYKYLIEKSGTKFIFEVGLQDYDRIIQMNREACDFFQAREMLFQYQEHIGDHSKQYAYQGLSRVIKNHF